MVKDYERLIQNTTHLPGQLLPPTATPPEGPPVRKSSLPLSQQDPYQNTPPCQKLRRLPLPKERIHSLPCESLSPSWIPERWLRYPLTSVDQREFCYPYATEGSVLFHIVVRELLYMMIGGIYPSGARGSSISDINTDFSEGIHRLTVGPHWRIGKQQDE